MKESFVSGPLFIALVGIAGTVFGALVNGVLATRAKVNEEMRHLRLESYPLLWQLTSIFSTWPRAYTTYADLEEVHRWFRSWYYEVGGLHLSENARARYGEVQELTAQHLAVRRRRRAQPHSPLRGEVYDGLMDACSALRTALTEDLESRKQRSVLQSIRLAIRHRKQKRKAAARLVKAGGARQRAWPRRVLAWCRLRLDRLGGARSAP